MPIAFTCMFDNNFLLKVLFALSTYHNVAIFSMDVKMFLQIGDLLEAFLAAKNRANVRFLTGVSSHVIKQALDSFEELTASRLITRVVSHSFRYLVGK